MNRFLRDGSAEKDRPKLLHSHHKDHVFESIMSRMGGGGRAEDHDDKTCNITLKSGAIDTFPYQKCA